MTLTPGEVVEVAAALERYERARAELEAAAADGAGTLACPSRYAVTSADAAVGAVGVAWDAFGTALLP